MTSHTLALGKLAEFEGGAQACYPSEADYNEAAWQETWYGEAYPCVPYPHSMNSKLIGSQRAPGDEEDLRPQGSLYGTTSGWERARRLVTTWRDDVEHFGFAVEC